MTLVEDAFGRALANLWMRDDIMREEPQVLASTVATLFAAGGNGVSAAADLLSHTGVGGRWNDVLRRDRAVALASRIRPLVIEPLVDILAGDGSVCQALASSGLNALTATERIDHYGERHALSGIYWVPFTDDLDFGRFDASTALLSTVLHHEIDPVGLLDALATTEISRWIVVENCVTPEFSRSFHQFADRFFNTCLNQFGVPCGEQHRTLDEWAHLLASYGTVAVIDDGFTVPGIPFPYSLIVVDRDNRASPVSRGRARG